MNSTRISFNMKRLKTKAKNHPSFRIIVEKRKPIAENRRKRHLLLFMYLIQNKQLNATKKINILSDNAERLSQTNQGKKLTKQTLAKATSSFSKRSLARKNNTKIAPRENNVFTMAGTNISSGEIFNALPIIQKYMGSQPKCTKRTGFFDH